jgi:hypothetical protein
MPRQTPFNTTVRTATKPLRRTTRSGVGTVGKRPERPTVAVEIPGGGTVLVDRDKVVDLLANGTPAQSGDSALRDLASITRLKIFSGSHRLEDRILDALRIRVRKQLAAIAEADIDLRSLGAPDAIADSMAAALPASHPFDELVGPFYDTSGLRTWLGLSRQRLNQRVKGRQLLACPLDGAGNVYPTWQFRNNGTVVAGLGDVLSILSKSTDDDWQIALWFSTPSEKLGNASPKDLLLKGRRVGAVIELAEQTAARWAR